MYIKFSYTITFKNLMNNATSHLSSLLCKSSINKYMIMVRNVTNEITKKNIKSISHYHYGVVVYNFSHKKKEIYRVFLKVCVKIHYIYIYMCVCACIKVKKGTFKVFINLKTNKKPIVNN